MAIMRDAVDLADFEEKGYKAKPRNRRPAPPEPKPLKIKQKKLEDITPGDVTGFTESLANKRNADGGVFIG